MTTLATDQDVRLGQGRSGVVYRRGDIARKVFSGDTLANLVHYVFSGAPNAYIWCEPAIRCAWLRRRILQRLVPFWFGDRLAVAAAHDYEFDPVHCAWQLNTAFVPGSHADLHHPYRVPRVPAADPVRDLAERVMLPLQYHLEQAGFDGLVWQAGQGNPVALNNFLCTGPSGESAWQWAWIDLESGVPALIPINPIDLLCFYLPKSFRHRRALFDDVDVQRLRAWLADHREALVQHLGPQPWEQLQQDVESLVDAQQQWKSIRRHVRSIQYRLRRGQITRQQADWYTPRPLRWYARESRRAVSTVAHKIVSLGVRLSLLLAGIDWKHAAQTVWGMLSSQKFRVRAVRTYIASRIESWRDRGQLEDAHADDLLRRLEGAESSRYLIDFGVHIAVKPIVKPLQWWLVPALMAAGAVDTTLGLFLLATGGAIIRTVYTLCRCIQNAVKRREVPYLALFVGVLPTVGNLAFPAQIIFTSAHERARVAQFLVYDTFTRIGRHLPIWGGPDTATEHFFNSLPDWLMRHRLPDPD